MTPVRIQRKRTKGWRMPPNTVYVGRPTKWGNRFVIHKERYMPRLRNANVWEITYAIEDTWGDITVGCGFASLEEARAASVELYRREGLPPPEDIAELRGKNLACWCAPGRCCHADVLLEIANAKETP